MEQGKTITLQRQDAGTELFLIQTGGTLILGDGALTYNGTDAQTAYQNGDYTVQSTGGQLIIDGGAVWERGAEYVPGTTAFTENTIVFYDNGTQHIYTNGGIKASKSLIANNGTLNLWGGVTLQNNDKANAKYGGAIYNGIDSKMNMYSGIVTKCTVNMCYDDRGMGASYMGNSFDSNAGGVPWESDIAGNAATTVFQMFGGSIDNNTAYGKTDSHGLGVADGGGVAIDQATMNLYGGEISRNHAGLAFVGAAGDGGGIYAGAYASVTINQASLEDNTATYGGGAYIDCVKTDVPGVAGETALPVHPGVTFTPTDPAAGITAADMEAVLGKDVEGSYGTLSLNQTRVNNNHLDLDDNGEPVGFGGGVYNRGDLLLNTGAYVSGNDRLYLEKDHIVTLGAGYTAQNQSSTAPLTINSRVTALGTNMIQMAAENATAQALKLLTEERAIHYMNIPMARSTETDEPNIIELNYFSITYYDRWADDPDLNLEHHEAAYHVRPKEDHTVMSFTAASKDFDAEVGRELHYWVVVNQAGQYLDDDGNVVPTIDHAARYYPGETIPAEHDVYLVAAYQKSGYTGVVINNMLTEDGKTETSLIGDVTLTGTDVTQNQTTKDYSFGTNTALELVVNSIQENGHQAGVLKSLQIYEEIKGMDYFAEPYNALGKNYDLSAEVVMKDIPLTVGGTIETETYVSNTIAGIQYYNDHGQKADAPADAYLSGSVAVTDGVVTYISKEKSIFILAVFEKPRVELKMTETAADGAEPAVLTEYYDTMRQAFTRMANIVSGTDTTYVGKTWASAVITPLMADKMQADGTGLVYYYGADYAGSYADNVLPSGKPIDVVFDLNGLTLDLQSTPAKVLSTYGLTLKNGTVIGHADAGESQFVVKNGGALTLDHAVLKADSAQYGVTVEADGKLTVDQDSQAGKVWLEAKNACVAVADPLGWTENLPGAAGKYTYTATLYTDLGALATSATKVDGKITAEGETHTDRNVISFDLASKATSGHNVRSHFALQDSVTDDADQGNADYPRGDETGNWFIGTDGNLYPRVKDVIPRLVCMLHDSQTEADQIRTEDAATGDAAREVITGADGTQTYYPIYFLYRRDYGYNNTEHPLSIVTAIRDAYGNRIAAAGGVVTFTMAQVDDSGEKNRVLTARAQVRAQDTQEYVPGTNEMVTYQAGTAVYTGTDANPTFPAGNRPYYLTGSFTGSNEYAEGYAKYWKVQDTDRADYRAASISGLGKLTIDPKDLDDESVQITSVTPDSAPHIGPEGAAKLNTSRAGTVRVRDNNTSLNLTSGDDLQNYYRKLTTVEAGSTGVKAGQIGDIPYYYADEIYYTATGLWYGPAMFNTTGMTDQEIEEARATWEADHARKIDGQDVGTYSVEVAAIKKGTPQSINYDGISGWRGQLFRITPYTARLNTQMTSHVRVDDPTDTGAVQAAIKAIINGTNGTGGLKITDIYGNEVPINQVTYSFVAADSKAKLNDAGWPCAEGLYSIEIHPYDRTADTAMTDKLVDGLHTSDNYSSVAVGHQALLITTQELTMDILVKNDMETEWTNQALKVPYIGEIYRDDTVKAFDEGDNGAGDHLKIVEKDKEGTADERRLKVTEYSLQVGLPDDPAQDAGPYVVKMVRNADGKTGYFFVRIAPRAVTITVRDQGKVYGTAKPPFDYYTNLVTLVGSIRRAFEDRGEIDETVGFFVHDVEKGIIGKPEDLSRADGENVGSYYYALGTFTAGPNYTLTVSPDTMFTIMPKSLSEVTDGNANPKAPAAGITLDCKTEVEYTGYPVSPLNSISYQTELNPDKPETLAERTDFTLTYYKEEVDGTWTELSTAPIAVGRYKLEITGQGNYENTLEQEFSVVAAGKDLHVVIQDDTVTYKGSAYYPSVKVRTENNALLNSSSYSLSYSYTDTTGKTTMNTGSIELGTGFTEAGRYTIYANGKGNYQGAVGSAVFTIEPKDLADGDVIHNTQPVKVEDIDPKTYSGEAITFDDGLNITYGGLEGSIGEPVTLTNHDDYELTYMNNTNAGTATVAILGSGNYTGIRRVDFTINRKPVYVEVTGTDGQQPTKLYGETDPQYQYTVYADAAGTEALADVEITGVPGRAPGSNAGAYALNLDAAQGCTLSAGPNYEIVLRGAPKLTIEQKPLGTEQLAAAERIVATIPYVEAVAGAAWPTPAITYWAAGMDKQTLGTDQFDVKYYTEAGSKIDPGTAITEESVGKYYALVTATADGNYSETVKLEFRVVKQGSILNVTADPTTQTYAGPDGVSFQLTATYGADSRNVTNETTFTAQCYAATGGMPGNIQVKEDGSFTAVNAGTYVISANYQTGADADQIAFGYVTVFVTPKDIAPDGSITVADIPEQDYTGDAITPVLTITDGGTKLIEDTDYTVSYKDNVHYDNAHAKAVITGMGNYTGVKEVTFRIGDLRYTLEYAANGGTGAPETAHSQNTFTIAAADMRHEDMTLDGKTVPVLFVGWSKYQTTVPLKSGDQLPEDMFYAGQLLTPDKIVTELHAVWGYDTDNNGTADVMQGTIQVVYSQGSAAGQAPKDDTKYLVGQMATAAGQNTLQKQNYVFMGWTPTAPTAGDHAVDTLSSYLKLVGGMFTEGTKFYVGNTGGSVYTLYPVWGIDTTPQNGTADFLEQQGSFLLIYNANGGKGGPEASKCQTGTNVTLSNETPTREGAAFLGWTTVQHTELLTAAPTTFTYYSKGTSFPVPATSATGYTTLYALWATDTNDNDKPDYEETQCTVTYDANGGEGTFTQQYLKDLHVPAASGSGLSKTGYTFDGWNTQADGQGTSYQPGDTLDIAGDMTLYAMWADNNHTVTVTVVGGGGTATANPETVRDGGTSTITFAPSTGYELGSVVVNGAVQPTTGTETELELTNITKDTAVVVTFKSNAFTVAAPAAKVYNGAEITPELHVSSGDTQVAADSYTVAYTAMANTGAKLGSNGQPLTAGTYAITVTGTGDYTGKTAATTFVITPKLLTAAMVDVAENADGTDLIITVTDNGTPLIEGTDYIVSHGGVKPNTDVEVKVTGLGNYKDTVTKPHRVSDNSQWTLTYKNGETEVETQQYTKGATVTVRSDAGLSKDGYVFGGWLHENGIIYQPGETFTITANTTLTAVWTEETTVQVTYYLLPGAGTETSEPVKVGESVPLKEALTRADYTFLGWTTSEGGKTIDTAENISIDLSRLYKAGEALVLTADTDLYPVWIKSAVLSTYHLVLYRADGGDDKEIESTAFLEPKGTNHAIIAGEPTRTGYEFTGWKSNIAGEADKLYKHGDAANGTCTINSDVTFTAQWDELPTYTVTYDAGLADGQTSTGTPPTDNTAYQSGAEVSVLGNSGSLSVVGYVFSGWSKTKGAAAADYQPGEKFRIDQNTTLYAVWQVKTYQVVTSAGAGGSITQGVTVKHGGSFAFQVTVDSGYKLDKVLVNGTAVSLTENKYTIENITENQLVIVTFTSTFGGGGGGGITPTPTPTPWPKPVTPDDTGVSDLLNTREHNPFLFGYPDGTFGPERNITRAEVAQMFYNLLLEKDVPITARFADVPDDMWYAEAINTLASLGVIQGLGNDMYAPDREITRAEFCAIATRFAKETAAVESDFVDVPKTHWARQYINTAASYGWIDGYGDNRFGPDDLITRAQAATMTNRMLGRLCDRSAIDEGKGRVFPDVASSHWAWYQIAEATTEHTFTIGEDYASETWPEVPVVQLCGHPAHVSSVEDLKNTLNNAAADITILLDGDIGSDADRLSDVTLNRNINLTLDLNGHTLYVTGNQTASTVACAITQTAGTLTVMSSGGT